MWQDIEKYTITNENDMYIFFQLINSLELNRIMDMGMFLKRIGAVSRQVRGFEIEKKVRLDAVDFMLENTCGIYHTIYNNIYSKDDLLNERIMYEKQYDMVMALHISELYGPKEMMSIWKWMQKHVKYIFTDCTSDEYGNWLMQFGRVKSISIENDRYALIYV